MMRAIILCLIVFLCALPAHARTLERNIPKERYLSDLLDAGKSRRYEGHVYSRFPQVEKKLRVSPAAHRDLLSRIFQRAKPYLYEVQPGDSIRKIAHEHRTTVECIKELNTLKSDRLKPGQKLWVLDAPFTIEIHKTLNRLDLKVGDHLIKEYPVSTGKSEAQTPLGTFFIRSRYPFPTWFHKGVVVSSASPDNFLGSRWLGFDLPQYGLHGTIFPELIGQSVSKGCVRMKNEDVEELYEYVPTGTMVIITEI